MVARKTLDVAVGDFIQSVGLLTRRVRAAAGSHELSLTESSVLARLAKDGPATIAELARLEAIRPQSMGETVSALEERGFIQRTRHPTDGRQMHIQITTQGAEVRNSARDAKRTWLAHAVTKLDNQDQATLFAAGEIIRRLAES